MKLLLWLLRGFVFFVLLGLAMKNSGEIELRFFFEASWHVPLSVTLLVAVVVGVVLGLAAILPRQIRQRRALIELRQQLAERNTVAESKPPVVVPDLPLTGI